MKVAILADTHWGARGESQIFLDYFSRFHREIFFPYIDQHNIKTVVHLGDLVDRRKYLNYTTAHTLRKEYIEPSQERNLTTHIIAGNHDCFYKNNNEINALREFVMGRPGFHIYSNPAIVRFPTNFDDKTCSYQGELETLMMPWISPENEEKSAEAIQNSKAKVMFAHLELVGFEMARGQMMDHGMDPDWFGGFKAVYTGHYHHKSSKGNIHYLGTPYEMTWADCDDPKGFHVLDIDTLKLEFIPNPITLFKKVHITEGTEIKDVEAIRGKITKLIVHPLEEGPRKQFEKLLKNAEHGALDLQVIDEHLSIDDSGGQVIMIENAEDTMKIVTDYIMASDMQVNKDDLVSVMRELYVEAQSA